MHVMSGAALVRRRCGLQCDLPLFLFVTFFLCCFFFFLRTPSSCPLHTPPQHGPRSPWLALAVYILMPALEATTMCLLISCFFLGLVPVIIIIIIIIIWPLTPKSMPPTSDEHRFFWALYQHLSTTVGNEIAILLNRNSNSNYSRAPAPVRALRSHHLHAPTESYCGRGSDVMVTQSLVYYRLFWL